MRPTIARVATPAVEARNEVDVAEGGIRANEALSPNVPETVTFVLAAEPLYAPVPVPTHPTNE